jgi:hypothetical protein
MRTTNGRPSVSKSIAKPGETLRSRSEPCEPTVELGEGKLGQPHWIGYYLLEWEILVYEQDECWEACFFNWDGHHEHVTAFSLSEARRKAKDRIEVLETDVGKNSSLHMRSEVGAAIRTGPIAESEEVCEPRAASCASARAKGAR